MIRPPRIFLAVLVVMAGLASSNAALAVDGLQAKDAAEFSRQLVALRNERVAIGLQAQAMLGRDDLHDQAFAVLRITRYSAQRQAVLDLGNAIIARARSLPMPRVGTLEELPYAEALDPFLVDAVQLIEPDLGDRLLRANRFEEPERSYILFDWLLSTLGTGGSYAISVGDPVVQRAIKNDPKLTAHLLEISSIARVLFDARANAPLALKALPKRIPRHWRRIVGATPDVETGTSGVALIGQLGPEALQSRLSALEVKIDRWEPVGCLGAAKGSIQLEIIEMIRSQQQAVPGLVQLHEQLLAIDAATPSLFLLEQFNEVDVAQVSLDSRWQNAGAALSATIETVCG